ncbi:hypothetical protein ACFFGR_05735 [Arthrobacter liuii]|uniref:Uncharacterized protein n=1 Tax=Arthrobacter liuii TaxID=1476996 RepID=A0ABQ2AZS9_9MICC|nr:hypothetical protein [Arthrobacter liuii]GGI00539.1 hypothetical protein GCM10007170_37910 [Arthrobacter liuii]
MRRTVRRRAAAGLVGALSLLLPAALPALAAPPTGEIVLDGATSAEGMAAGEGTTFMPGNSPPVISSAVTSAKAPPPGSSMRPKGAPPSA